MHTMQFHTFSETVNCVGLGLYKPIKPTIKTIRKERKTLRAGLPN